MSLVRQSFSGRWGMEAPTLFGMSSILTVAPIWRDYTGSAHLAEGIPLYTLTISVCSWKALFIHFFMWYWLGGQSWKTCVCVWYCFLEFGYVTCGMYVSVTWESESSGGWRQRLGHCWSETGGWSTVLLEPTVALSPNQLTIGDLW